MKRLVAVLFSLLLLWAQGSAMGLPLAAVTGFHPVCACCDCNRASCCQQPSSSSTEPFSSTVIPRVFESVPLLVPAVQYELPGAPLSEPPEATSFLQFPVPLFQQHCSLLI